MTVIGLFFIMSACDLVFLFSNTFKPTPPPPVWLTDWWQNPVCQPPCWYGITPGITTITDTAKILSELPWVKITYGPARPLDTGSDMQLDWVAKQPDHVGGLVASDDQGKITVSLRVNGKLSTRLEDVVEAFGPPSDVMALDCEYGVCETRLIYISSGMMLVVTPPRDSRRFVKITPDTQVKEICFFPPGREGYFSAFPIYSDAFVIFAVPWEGYTKYKVAIQ